MPPTFFIVPGAWHRKESVSLLENHLWAAGYPTRSVTLPTVGTTKPLAADTEFLRDEMLRLLTLENKDLIVVLHSYAGFPGSTAINGLGKSDRDGNHRGCVLGLIYISAFMPTENQSVEGIAGGTLPSWQDLDEAGGLTRIPNPKPILYPDVSDDVAAEAIASLQVQSLRSFRDGAGHPHFKDHAFNGRRAYVLTSEDPCFLVEWQEGGLNGSGVEWEKIIMPTSHSPFLSRPKELAEHMVGFAKKWES